MKSCGFSHKTLNGEVGGGSGHDLCWVSECRVTLGGLWKGQGLEQGPSARPLGTELFDPMAGLPQLRFSGASARLKVIGQQRCLFVLTLFPLRAKDTCCSH